jgi:hypothetical protein
VTPIPGAIPRRLISGLFHFAEYSIFCKVKEALVHATWYITHNRYHYPMLVEPVFL